MNAHTPADLWAMGIVDDPRACFTGGSRYRVTSWSGATIKATDDLAEALRIAAITPQTPPAQPNTSNRDEWDAIRRDEAEQAVLSEMTDDDDVSDDQHCADERWGLR